VDVHIGKLRRKIDAPGGIPLLYNVEHRLDDGSYLVIGRSSQEVERLQELDVRALKLGVLPPESLGIVRRDS
jgi:hypothetical protein